MKARIIANGVQVRKESSNSSPAIGSVALGEEVYIEAEYGEWVKLASGGWVMACYTEVTEAGTSWNSLTDKPFDAYSDPVWSSGIDPTVDYDKQPFPEDVSITRTGPNYYTVTYPENTVEPGFCDYLKGAYIVYTSDSYGTEESSYQIKASDFDENGNLNCEYSSGCNIQINDETGAVVMQPMAWLNGSKKIGNPVLRIEWQWTERIDGSFLPWLVVNDDGWGEGPFSANMTYDEAVDLWKSRSLIGGCIHDMEGMKLFTHIYYSDMNNYFTLIYQDGELMFDYQGVRIAEPM